MSETDADADAAGMSLATLVDRLNDRLDVAAYADVDASANGLQLAGPDRVERVACAVDAAVATVEAAVDRDVDAMVVHHGVSWGGIERVTGPTYDRLAPLVRNDIALYAVHLPLDGHQELGNAAGVADHLELVDRAPFGSLGDEVIGQRGRLPESRSLQTIRDRLADLDHPSGPQVLPFGPDAIEDVAIVTGAGADWLEEAAAAEVDLFVTGEGKQRLYHLAREHGLNCVLAGHYGTETFGVRRLAALCAEWGLTTTFIDHPTGL